jgi:hypothetical protein
MNTDILEKRYFSWIPLWLQQADISRWLSFEGSLTNASEAPEPCRPWAVEQQGELDIRATSDIASKTACRASHILPSSRQVSAWSSGRKSSPRVGDWKNWTPSLTHPSPCRDLSWEKAVCSWWERPWTVDLVTLEFEFWYPFTQHAQPKLQTSH